MEQASFVGAPIAYCEVCHRRLSNPVSIEAHAGPVCRGKGHKSEGDTKMDQDYWPYLDIPITDGIVLRRLPDGRLATNVPHVVTHHSPTGFEIGYAGSGPADLALNIAECIVRREYANGRPLLIERCFKGECTYAAFVVHQDLKRKFIATLDRNAEEAIIPYDAVNGFVANKLLEAGVSIYDHEQEQWDE